MAAISPIKIIGHAIMMAEGLKLATEDSAFSPDDYKPDDQDHYSDAMSESNATVAIPTEILWTFQPTEPNKHFQDSADEQSKNFKSFHDDIIDHVKTAHQLWTLQAKFKDLKVMSVSAIGAPGCLDGPELESNIKNMGPLAAAQGNEKKYRDAVAAGVSKNFKDWQGKVMVPGLPWYPAFAAYPGPMAAPMPNIPMPLIACPSAMMTKIVVPDELKSSMVDELDSSMKDEDPDKQHEMLFAGIGTVLALAFLMWLPAQQVMLVLGKGPVPSFAPPYVPVGPVIGGDNIATPGHLMA